MDIETNAVAWLTAKEVEDAVRAYVRTRGYEVRGYAKVTGLELGEEKHAVSVSLDKSCTKVETGA